MESGQAMNPKNIRLFSLAVALLLPGCLLAGDYLPEKQGSYSFYNNIGSAKAEYAAFGNQVKALSDFFHETLPVMKTNQGFDLKAILFGQWDDEYRKRASSYGLRGELRFDFQLFLKASGKETKWTVEPPHWSFRINDTEAGHGGNLKEGNAGSLLKEMFTVFPLVREVAPGVQYRDCESRTCGGLVVFNPDRPPFWLPVTVAEIVKAKLEFYKADASNKMLYDYIKPLVEKMSPAELSAPAFFGSEDAILNVNGNGQGLQIMRFNPDYWDRTLQPSAIQWIAIGYSEFGHGSKTLEEQKAADAEFMQNNGHPDYARLSKGALPIGDLPKFIMRKRPSGTP
jgi:hypothetical protein